MGTPISHQLTQDLQPSDFESMRLRVGQTLWLQGDPPRQVFWIRRGLVRLVRTLRGGRGVSVGLARPGEAMGVEGLLGFDARQSTAEVLHPGVASVVPTASLQERAGQSDPHRAFILEALRAQRRRALEVQDNYLSGDIRCRLSALLLSLSRDFGIRDARGCFVPLRLTRADIAQMLGCRSETIIRTIGQLKAEGLVRFQREGFVLSDVAELERLISVG